MKTDKDPTPHYFPVSHDYSGMPDRSAYSSYEDVPTELENKIQAVVDKMIFFCCGKKEG